MQSPAAPLERQAFSPLHALEEPLFNCSCSMTKKCRTPTALMSIISVFPSTNHRPLLSQQSLSVCQLTHAWLRNNFPADLKGPKFVSTRKKIKAQDNGFKVVKESALWGKRCEIGCKQNPRIDFNITFVSETKALKAAVLQMRLINAASLDLWFL